MDRTHARALFFSACCALLAACGARDQGDAARQGAGGDVEALPKPEAGSGSITGMPDKPGPGPVGAALADGATIEGDDALPLPPDAGDLPAPPDQAQPGAQAQPDQGSPAAAAPEPTPADAASVVSAYYAAIAAGQYPRAYALWSGGGQASGQSAQQFAGGFSDTASVSVAVGAPGRVDAAAGSRYIEIPVTVTATRTDGSVHRYAGTYTLRRAVVDGATAEQRAWRIASADLREIRP